MRNICYTPTPNRTVPFSREADLAFLCLDGKDPGGWLTGFYCVETAEEAPPSINKSREFLALPFSRFSFHWWEKALPVLGNLWHQQSHVFACFQGASASGDGRNILYKVWKKSQSWSSHKGKLQQKMVNNMFCSVSGVFSLISH